MTAPRLAALPKVQGSGTAPLLRAWSVVGLIILVVVCTACSTPPANDSAAEIPQPVIDGLDPASQSLIEQQRLQLQAALAGAAPGPPALESERQALADEWGGYGRLLLAYDFTTDATACFADAVALEPSFRWRYHAGVSLQLDDRLHAARAELEQALALRPEDLPTLIRLGRITHEQGDLDSSAQFHERALAINAESAAALHGLGRIASALNEPQRAAELFKRVLALQPGAGSAHYGLGLALRQLGQTDEARLQLAMATGAVPVFSDPLVDSISGLLAGSRELHEAAGSAAASANDFEQAVAQFERAVELAPKDAGARLKLAAALGELGQHRGAIRHLREAVLLDPDNAEGFFNLGTALSRVGQLQAALDAFSTVVTLRPNDAEALLRRAQVADALQMREIADQDYETLLARDAKDRVVLMAVAARATRAGQLARAFEWYQAAIEVHPLESDAYLGAFRAARRQRDYSAAREVLEHGLERLPQHPQMTDLLARLQSSCEDEAIRNGDNALRLARRNQRQHPSMDHRETLAMALAATGDFEAAVAEQRGLLAEAEASERTSALPRIRRYLALYEAKQDVRVP